MLSPKRTKYRKMQRGRLKGSASRNTQLQHGNFGLQALAPAWISSRQIEATRRAISRYTKKKGKLWIKIFPDKSITARAKESRMGSGKGAVDYWAAIVRPGNILFEVAGLSQVLAEKALNLASYKLPIQTRILAKERNLI